MSVKNNIKEILSELDNSGAKLIAVSKTQSVEKIKEAYEAGQRIFGENKAQEMLTKYESLPKDIEWHMIGHLQTNKVKYIASFVSLIHSIDSLRLLEEVNKQARRVNRVIPCLLQVHIANEETKFGFDDQELIALISSNQLTEFTNIKIIGLMGMATFTSDEKIIRDEFHSLKNLFGQIKNIARPSNVEMKELSMGMSSDYKIAIAEGSTFVRVGTAIFGERNYGVN